jgi:predicted ATPase/class 3 adenylate cyclase
MREDELRPVTSLFADVVGSTSLGEHLGPDEVKALIGECVSRMSASVEGFGGTIQAYMGDGICAYFGVPAAHEDDPGRAARAGLRILTVIRDYAKEIEDAWDISGFNVRVGINTGQTAVGLVGAADPQAVALGDTTNVAARLQSAAEPGTIAVGDLTAKRLAADFVLEPLGDIPVKGRAEAVPAWRLVGPRAAAEAPVSGPIVGRDVELVRLSSTMDELVAGRGQVLFLVGEAGMGKTRLVNELRGIAGERVIWLDGRCQSYSGEVLYSPFVEMLREWLGVDEAGHEVAVRTKLRARLGALLGPRLDDVLPFLGRLMSVPIDPEADQRIQGLSPEALAEGISTAFVAWIEALTGKGAVVVAVDDLHWADSSTRQLAEGLLPITDRAPLLLAAALRPDTASEGWRFRLRVLTEYAYRATELPLGPLDQEDAGRLVDALLPGGMVDQSTKREIVNRAEGNPLYVEELLRVVMDAGAGDRRRTWTMTTSPAEALPPAIESLLVARIDRLPPSARRLAQVASVIGRTFPVRVLQEVAGEEDVSADLATLLRSGIVREVRRYPELECTFRHGLIQESTLATLPQARRRELYGRVAHAYEELFADSLEERLELLAFFYYRSNEPGKALEYLWKAAGKAFELHANAHAEELLNRGKKVAAKLDDPAAAAMIEQRLRGLDSS